MTEINDQQYTLSAVTANTYTLAGVDSSTFPAYYSGGIARKVLAQSTGQWFISALYDSSTIDPLDFASAESSPDALVRIIVDHQEALLFGTHTVEFWRNTGASPFPFERIPGSVIERGCIAPLSPAKRDNTVFWLGDDKIIYKAQGYTPVRVSTFAVEEIIRVASRVDDARGFTFSMGGHAFYVLTLPSASRTLVYDIATGSWCEWQSGTSLDPATWAIGCSVDAWGKVYGGVTDPTNLSTASKVCELDLNTYSDLGNYIRRSAVTPPIYPDGKRAVMTLAEIECETGVGLNTGQGSDPLMMLSWSDDGGATFSNERRVTIGATGERRNRVQFKRLGMFRQRELRFSMTDPVKTAWYGLRYEARLG